MTERIIPISQTYDRCVSAPSLLTISVEIPLDTAYITMPNVFECTLYAGTRMRISSGELARSMPRLRELTLRNFEIDESKGTGVNTRMIVVDLRNCTFVKCNMLASFLKSCSRLRKLVMIQPHTPMFVVSDMLLHGHATIRDIYINSLILRRNANDENVVAILPWTWTGVKSVFPKLLMLNITGMSRQELRH
jgi:hypothetical protein